MLSVKQVADMSGRTERTIWRMIASGKLAHVRDGNGRVWIDELAVPQRREEASGSVVAELRREMAELRRRVEALEAGARRLRPAPAARPSVQVRAVAQVPTPASSGELPDTKRQRGFWVEQHGGPKGTSVRIGWDDVAAWSSVGDAIAGMREHGYEPRECADPGCGCHVALAS
jgi:hypothetical protein